MNPYMLYYICNQSLNILRRRNYESSKIYITGVRCSRSIPVNRRNRQHRRTLIRLIKIFKQERKHCK